LRAWLPSYKRHLPFHGWQWDVRFASEADICGAKGNIRFTPNNDHKNGYPQPVMSASPLKADMCSARADVS